MKPKELPILYTDKMLKARDDGRKNNTRRIALLPEGYTELIITDTPAICVFTDIHGSMDSAFPEDEADKVIYPKWNVGDVMLIKEDYKYSVSGSGVIEVCYKTKYENSRYKVFDIEKLPKDTQEKLLRGIQDVWKSKLLMFNFMCRKKDKVTNVKVHRIQEISPHDCVLEGCPTKLIYDERGTTLVASSAPKEVFRNLWDSINTKRGYPWENNDWVFAYEFERLK